MEREASQPPRSDAELEAELERLSQEAQAKLEAQRAEEAQRASERADAHAAARRELAEALGGEASAEAGGGSLGLKLGGVVLGLLGLVVLWAVVVKPLLRLALGLGVLALLAFGAWKLYELMRGGGEPAGE